MRRTFQKFHAPIRSFVSTSSHPPLPPTTPTVTSTLSHPTRSQSTAAAQVARPHIESIIPPIISHVTPPPQSKKSIKPSFSTMSDSEIITAVESGTLKFFNLENDLGDYARAVKVRRMIVEKATSRSIASLPHENYNYAAVAGQCCENVIGTVPIPVGVAGPLLIDGKEYYLPMATVEGALVASTTRGCKAISMSGGARTEIIADGMSRAPVLGAPSAKVAQQVKQYIETHITELQTAFNSTSRFARLKDIKTIIAGRKIYVRFRCTTGDAMGMNMVGKGVDHALSLITTQFPSVSVLSLSGNVCTDKKPSAINFIEGRGKSVVVDAVISKSVVEKLLKTTVDALIDLNYSKNLLGSAMAGSIGGLNAHASNVVTAMFLATGQDCAQNVESSNCITLMEKEGEDLYMSVTMPSLEVGTVGGGTTLPGQAAMLDLLGVRGSHPTAPGTNASQLARIIASTVMAGELSLMSALSSGHLISSHMKLNRKAHPTPETPKTA